VANSKEAPRRMRVSAAHKLDPRVDRNRAAAMAAGRALLVEEGLDAVTHVRVAQRSGVSRATLYRQWPDPSSLRQATIEFEAEATPHRQLIGEVATEIRNELSLLRDRFIDREASLVLATLVERSEWDPGLMRTKRRLTREHLVPLRNTLVAGIERGELRQDLDLALAISLLVGPLVFRRFISSEALPRRFVDDVVSSFLDEARPDP
jgi:AcrR family transcriptional regulator